MSQFVSDLLFLVVCVLVGAMGGALGVYGAAWVLLRDDLRRLAAQSRMRKAQTRENLDARQVIDERRSGVARVTRSRPTKKRSRMQ